MNSPEEITPAKDEELEHVSGGVIPAMEEVVKAEPHVQGTGTPSPEQN